MIKLLIKSGGDIHARTMVSYNTGLFCDSFIVVLQDGCTVLYKAAQSGKYEIVDFLISVGCDMYARNDVC